MNNLTPVLEVKHYTFVGINCDFINCCVPQSWVPFKVEGVEFFQGEEEGTQGVGLIESAFSLLLQNFISAFELIVTLCKAFVFLQVVLLF